jgi:hypothetical protein
MTKRKDPRSGLRSVPGLGNILWVSKAELKDWCPLCLYQDGARAVTGEGLWKAMIGGAIARSLRAGKKFTQIAADLWGIKKDPNADPRKETYRLSKQGTRKTNEMLSRLGIRFCDRHTAEIEKEKRRTAQGHGAHSRSQKPSAFDVAIQSYSASTLDPSELAFDPIELAKTFVEALGLMLKSQSPHRRMEVIREIEKRLSGLKY